MNADHGQARAFESVSTWRAEAPSTATAVRQHLVDEIAAAISTLSPERIRVCIDGLTGAGKTAFSHELAAALRSAGRTTARASLDDFKHPWRHAYENGYDRLSGSGYHANAYDHDTARDLLLEPAGPDGSGRVALCGHDPLTGQDHRHNRVQLAADTVLIVDSIFAFRPEYNDFWDYRIWLEVSPELALQRGIERDSELEGVDEARRLHRDRYHVAVSIYVDEVAPRSLADVTIDNSDFEAPRIIPTGAASSR